MVRFFINLKPKNSCYIRNYEEKCECGCECDHSKIEVRAQVRAEQFLKCGRACAAQENTSQLYFRLVLQPTKVIHLQFIYLKIIKTIFTFGLQGWPQLISSFSIFKSNVSGHDSSRGRTISKVTILLESWWNTWTIFDIVLWKLKVKTKNSFFAMLMIKNCFWSFFNKINPDFKSYLLLVG